jgi:predicted transcriptional regulator
MIIMPETEQTHKEIVEIKKEVRDIRQTQDAQIYQDREKWEALLDKTVDDDAEMMRVLLAVDGLKSAKDIEKETTIYQMKCWRLLNKLDRAGVISKLEQTKKGSPVFITSRWYRILRLDEKVQKKYSSLTAPQVQAPLPVQEGSNEEEQPS